MEEFIEKSFDELEAMTDKERFEYRKAENEHIAAKQEKAIEDKIAKAIEDADTSDETVKMFEAQLEKLKKENITFGLAIKQMTEGKSNTEKAVGILEDLSNNMEAIKEISNLAPGTSKEVAIKALVLRSAITNNEQAVDLNTVGQYGRATLSMWDLFNKVPMSGSNNNGTVRYYDWDEATTTEAAEMVAEGAAFPESTATWARYTEDLKKVGDTIPVTDEFFEDEAMFAAELRMFLMRNVEDIIDYQICYGAGTGENLTGMFTSATDFTPATVTHVSDPTMYDLCKVMVEQVTKTRGSKYRPNFVAMNISSINRMELSKDANENYIMPPFVSRDGAVVANLRVIEANIINDDEMIVGDSRYGVIYHKPGMVLSRGYSGTQFAEDEITLKVRKRLLFLIRNVDQAAFIKVTDIDAAIAAIDATS